MSIKQQLLEAAKNIETAVKLDSIFESADLSADVKAKFETVFESAVKAQAVALAETHVNEIAEKSEQMVSAQVEAEVAELTETLNKYLDHVAGHWMTENKLAVQNNLKVEMFESMMTGMKELFVDHNVIVPEEAVNVVEELEAEIAEAREELNVALNEKAEMAKSIDNIKRDTVVEKAIADLTESQKEKVASLIEGIEYNEKFDAKLAAIVEMTAAKVVTESTEVTQEEQVISESEQVDPNFKPEVEEEVVVESVNPMTSYLAAL